MFDLNAINFRNEVAAKLIKQGRPQREALSLVSDPRRSKELKALLEDKMEEFRQTNCPKAA